MNDHPKLGTQLTSHDQPLQRDAVHVCVASVIAGADLEPGTHVGFSTAPGQSHEGIVIKAYRNNPPVESYRTTTDGKMSVERPQLVAPIGIIDPFLTEPVREGNRCWILLYPDTITGIRHLWAHPVFDSDSSAHSQSTQWLEDFAKRIGIPVSDLMERCTIVAESSRGSYWPPEDIEAMGDTVDDATIAQLWKHYEIVTGKTVPDKDEISPFSCNCY